MIQKIKEGLGIQDAMDNLAAIMGIDLESLSPIGIVKGTRIVTDKDEFAPNTIEWLSAEGNEPMLDVLGATYYAIQQHLLSVLENPGTDWESEKTRKGVAAMMSLVGESAAKLDTYLTLRTGNVKFRKVADLEEFRNLQRFYVTRFASKFEGGVEGDRAWMRQWLDNESAPLLDISRTGLKDFETVRRDSEYELFYIRNEDGKPYFSTTLLRNIRLACDFDVELESFEEDPLLKVRAIQDRDMNASAMQIIDHCREDLADFYKLRKKVASPFTDMLNVAAIALFMAANPMNLLQNTMGKSCLQYFADFHDFLRKAMRTADYQKWIAYPPEGDDKTARILLNLTHALCKRLFERIGGVKQEAIGLIHRTMRRGEEIKQKKEEPILKGETIWNQFQLDDEKFRTLLSQFPNGPLFKILDLIREEQEEDVIIPFDPIGQQNLPSHLFDIKGRKKMIEVLRIPSPTRQSLINKVEVIDEFRGYLRSLSERQAKLLLFNLQDRTSWKEFTRCRTLENLQMSAEFSAQLSVVTLPKNTDFYYQINESLDLNKAEDFLKAFRAQFDVPESCGYYFPPKIKQTALIQFVEGTLPVVHEQFFNGKHTLTRRNREDFIEIFCQFLVLKCIEWIDPDAISFTCKDSIDTGAGSVAAFYGFLKLLSSDFTKRETQDFFRWILYAPALFLRERSVDPERLNRALSVLQRIDGNLADYGEKTLKGFEEFFAPKTFQALKVEEIAQS